MPAADWQLKFWDQHVEQIVKDLRRMADRVERAAQPRETASLSGQRRWSGAAEAVQHEIAWGIANTGAHRLMADASMLDWAERNDDE